MGHSRASWKSRLLTIPRKQKSRTRMAFFESTYHAKQNSIDSEEQIETLAAVQQLGGVVANRLRLQEPPGRGQTGIQTGVRHNFAYCCRVSPVSPGLDKMLSQPPTEQPL